MSLWGLGSYSEFRCLSPRDILKPQISKNLKMWSHETFMRPYIVTILIVFTVIGTIDFYSARSDSFPPSPGTIDFL